MKITAFLTTAAAAAAAWLTPAVAAGDSDRLSITKSCCAGWVNKGSFCTVADILSDMGGGGGGRRDSRAVFLRGLIGVDAENSKAVMAFGCNKEQAPASVEESIVGWYARPALAEGAAAAGAAAGKLQVTAWLGKKCFHYNMDSSLLPKMCFGEGTNFPNLIHKNKIDPLLTLHTYESAELKSSTGSSASGSPRDSDAESDDQTQHPYFRVAVNPITCYPYHSVWAFPRGRKGEEHVQLQQEAGSHPHPHLRFLHSALEHMQGEATGGELHSEAAGMDPLLQEERKDRLSYAFLHFHNSSAAAPPADKFAVPSWCGQK